jgi:RHS repeat-associated protein
MSTTIRDSWRNLIGFVLLLLSQGCVSRAYIRLSTPLQPVQRANDVERLPKHKLAETIEYFNGLGKRVQLVEARISPQGKDRVTPIEYNSFGVQVRSYLPYVAKTTSGAYQTDAIADQTNFYLNAAGITHTTYPFSEKILERSPLLRVVEESPPGDMWRPGSSHSNKRSVSTNRSGEVRRWQWGTGYTYLAQAPPRFYSDSFYQSGHLQVIEKQDENGHRVQSFLDDDGRVMLRRGLLRNTAAVEVPLNTYYFYDDFGNLRLILPPMAINEMQTSNTWIVTTGILDRWATEYRYDSYHRRVEIRAPSRAPTYIVYDKLDRPVLTQDGELRRVNRWKFTKFDRLGRQILTGIYHDGQHLTRESMQAYADTYVDNVQTFFFERRQQAGGSSFAMEFDYSQGYSDKAFPPTPQATILSVTYYDNYDFNNNSDPADDYSYVANPAFPGNKPTDRLQGRVTGQKFKILAPPGSTLPKWSTTAYFYDDYARVIQTYQRNHKGISIIDTEYNFAGWVTRENTLHTGTDGVIVRKRHEYDHSGRLVRVHQQNNNDPEVLVVQQDYDEPGRLRSKHLHSEDQGRSFLQQVDYEYNIRGWLTGINSPWLVGTTPAGGSNSAPDLFGLDLRYEHPDPQFGNTPQYNGNVSLATWRTLSPGRSVAEQPVFAYVYEYDGIDQLTAAHFRAFNSSNQPAPGNDNYTAFASYDLNGNLTHLFQFGATAFDANGVARAYGPVDDLNYTLWGNRLIAVDDSVSADLRTDDVLVAVPHYGFSDRGRVYDGTHPEYIYDGNGNMVRDANKAIDVRYNYLNLPEEVDFGGGDVIRWVYDASGARLQQIVLEDGIGVETIDWVGGIVYKDDLINYFDMANGRVSRVGAGELRFEYYLKDHVGNVRVSFTKGSDGVTPRILQENHYYPFGMPLRGLSERPAGTEGRVGYGGKEITDTRGLNWYHYGARYYDPELGRWHVTDPGDQYHSPYAFAANNPVRFVDPTGGSVEDGVPDDLKSGEQIILNWLLHEDFPTSNWEKLYAPTSPFDEHGSKVKFTVNWFLLKAIEEKKANATLYDVLYNAWTWLTAVRKGAVLMGGRELPSSSESLILRDAQRYLWGRVGITRFCGEVVTGICHSAAWYFPAALAWDIPKFVEFLTFTDSFFEIEHSKPQSALGGHVWFGLGKIDWLSKDVSKMDTQANPALLKFPTYRDLERLK